MSKHAYAQVESGSPVLDALEELLGERVTTAMAVREHHGRGEDYFKPVPSEAVCFPHTTEEVAEIVKICAAHRVPVIPFGTGTSLEGHVTAPHGGITIDLMQMNEVLEVHPEDLDCRVQAGVTRKQVNEYLRDTGMFFPIDPGADASLGGMASTRASGTNAVRYGTMKENVLGLTVVTADGKIIRTGGRAKKSAAGYDLTRIFVGSEGTLGVITEVHLKLYGIPEKIASAVCQYPSLGEAVDSVILTIQAGVPVARIELLDALMMEQTIAYSKLEGYETKPTLFYEFHGTEAGVEEQAQLVREIADEFGGSAFQWTTSQEERNKLWQARHDAYYAGTSVEPTKLGMSTDVCVPISRLAECILATEQDTRASGFDTPIVGHVGDVNFHVLFMLDPDDADEVRRVKECNQRIVERAIAMGGTCTGEHGIGVGKMDYLPLEHGEDAVDLMRTLKRAYDPDNIMNPGKMVRL
ncbi:MAG: FAD-binding oxidoreductase [Alphaproteobacteria bacterium]|nr:FAD-binding oxidoreductase [Alphaproteobacteria bacterium]